MHWEYHSLWRVQQAPEAQVVPPSQLLPPHWPQTGTVEGLGWLEVVVVVVVLMLVLVVLVVRVVAELVEEDETGGLVLNVEPMGPNLMLADYSVSKLNNGTDWQGEHTESNVGTGVVVDHVLESTRGRRAATAVRTKLGRVGREVGVEPEHVGVELVQSQHA